MPDISIQDHCPARGVGFSLLAASARLSHDDRTPFTEGAETRPRLKPASQRLFAAAAVLLALSACGPKYADQAPRSPQESLQSIQVLPGFKVELFASEPLVFDPVEVAFDENGRVFVAEMLDYPEDPPP